MEKCVVGNHPHPTILYTTIKCHELPWITLMRNNASLKVAERAVCSAAQHMCLDTRRHIHNCFAVLFISHNSAAQFIPRQSECKCGNTIVSRNRYSTDCIEHRGLHGNTNIVVILLFIVDNNKSYTHSRNCALSGNEHPFHL